MLLFLVLFLCFVSCPGCQPGGCAAVRPPPLRPLRAFRPLPRLSAGPLQGAAVRPPRFPPVSCLGSQPPLRPRSSSFSGRMPSGLLCPLSGDFIAVLLSSSAAPPGASPSGEKVRGGSPAAFPTRLPFVRCPGCQPAPCRVRGGSPAAFLPFRGWPLSVDLRQHVYHRQSRRRARVLHIDVPKSRRALYSQLPQVRLVPHRQLRQVPRQVRRL